MSYWLHPAVIAVAPGGCGYGQRVRGGFIGLQHSVGAGCGLLILPTSFFFFVSFMEATALVLFALGMMLWRTLWVGRAKVAVVSAAIKLRCWWFIGGAINSC